MGATVNWMRGAALGAGLMYFLDPDRGRRRRALVRDKARRWTTLAERGTDRTLRDLANRGKGLVTEAATHIPFTTERLPDEVLEARVRSKLGRLTGHPGAIDVRVTSGIVRLTGDIIAKEAPRLLSAISGMIGVAKVDSQLHVHAEAGDFPGLQGNARKPQPRFELMQTHWSPAARFLTASAGGALAVYGIGKGGLRGILSGLAGGSLLARSLTNMEFKRLIGTQPGYHCIDICKAINIAAPVEKVYEFWANYENFPRFMSHLKEVRETTPGRSHWVACGPGGITAEWDAEITQVVPKQILAWRSVPGSAIENAGTVRFDQNADNSTRLTVHLEYQPPAGVIGHALAKLFGADPKKAMDEDLVRLKSLLEVGKTRAHHETITQTNLSGVAKTLVPAEMSRAATVN